MDVGRHGTLCRGPLPVKPSRAGGVHTGAGNRRRPGLLGTRLHRPASSLPQEDGILGAPGVARSTGVCRRRGLGPGLGGAKPPGAAGRHQPWAGLRRPPGRAAHYRLGGPAQPLVSDSRRGRHAQACAHACRRAGPDVQASEPSPGPKDPSPQQGRQPWSLPAGVRHGTPGVDAGLVSGEEDPPGPTLATGLSLGLRDTATAPAPRPPHLCRDPKGPAPRVEPRRARHPPSSRPALRWDPRPPPLWGWAWWDRCLRGRRWVVPGGWSQPFPGETHLREEGNSGPVSASAQAEAGLKHT